MHPDKQVSDPTQSVKECSYGSYSPRDEFCQYIDDVIANKKSMELQKRNINRTEKIVELLIGEMQDPDEYQRLLREEANDCNTIILDAVRDTKDYVLNFTRKKLEDARIETESDYALGYNQGLEDVKQFIREIQ